MTTSRRGARRTPVRRPRKRTRWHNELFSMDIGNTLQLSRDILSQIAQTDKVGLTLIRTLLHLFIQPTSMFGTVGLQALDFAIGVFEEDAFAAGALPDLNVEGERPPRGWAWKERCLVPGHTTAGAVDSTVHIERDLKSRRRIDDGDLLLIVNNNSAQGSAFNVTVEGEIRCLLTLP